MIVLIGKSGAGKTTIESLMVSMGYEKIVSHTTRPKRPGEIDGVDYHFVDYFHPAAFLEHVEYNGYQYGIHFNSIKDHAVVVVEEGGLRQILNKRVECFIIEIQKPLISRIRHLILRDGLKGLKRVLYDLNKFKNIPKNAIIRNNGSLTDLEKKIREALNELQ